MKPTKRSSRIALLFTLALIASLAGLFTPSADATTITVDGNGADWPVGVPTSLLITDGQDIAPAQSARDVDTVYFTSNTTDMFWRFDTVTGPTAWTKTTFIPTVLICLDVDNNTATGFLETSCANQAGVDFEVFIGDNNGLAPINLTADIVSCTSGGCATFVGSGSAATAGTITEVSLPFSVLGITGPAVCGVSDKIIPSALYFDNGVPSADDNVPDSGTLAANIPCPTPVGLNSFTASGTDLSWSTATEFNVAGYNVFRGTSDKRVDAVQVNSGLVPAKGDSVAGASYTWKDTNALPAARYYYWLQVVNTDNSLSEYGPAASGSGASGTSFGYLPLVVK